MVWVQGKPVFFSTLLISTRQVAGISGGKWQLAAITLKVEPSKRVFPTHAQRVPCRVSIPLRATLLDCGLVISAVISLAALPPSLPPVSMFIQMDAPCSLETAGAEQNVRSSSR